MVRIPSFARRSADAGTAAEDQTRDGRVDERDEPRARDDTTTDRPATDTRNATVRRQVDDRGSRTTGAAAVTPADTETQRDQADRAVAERAATERETDRTEADRIATDRTAADRMATDRERVVTRPAEPQARARASLLATLGLVFGVAAALFVLTGLLAGYGVALGIVGLLLSIGGVSATGKRHVAGKSDALLGIALNIGAMIFGALALTGALTWLTTETDKVEQFRQWLDTQFVDRF